MTAGEKEREREREGEVRKGRRRERESRGREAKLSLSFLFSLSPSFLPPPFYPPAVRPEVQALGRPDVGVDGPRGQVREPDEGPPRPPCRWRRRRRRRRRRRSDSSCLGRHRLLPLGALVVAFSDSPVVVDLGMLLCGRWLAAGARPDAQRALLRRGHRKNGASRERKGARKKKQSRWIEKTSFFLLPWSGIRMVFN